MLLISKRPGKNYMLEKGGQIRQPRSTMHLNSSQQSRTLQLYRPNVTFLNQLGVMPELCDSPNIGTWYLTKV